MPSSNPVNTTILRRLTELGVDQGSLPGSSWSCASTTGSTVANIEEVLSDVECEAVPKRRKLQAGKAKQGSPTSENAATTVTQRKKCPAKMMALSPPPIDTNSDDDVVVRPARQPTRRHSEVCAERIGMSPSAFRQLKRLGAPLILFALLASLFRSCLQHGGVPTPIDGVEFFSGVGNIAARMNKLGYDCLAYDINHADPGQNLNTDEGFITALSWGARIRENGLCSWGTVCSSWVWLSRQMSRRSVLKPFGDESREFVRLANQQVSRMCLLWFILFAKAVCVLLEQPASSIMNFHPRFPKSLHTCYTWMGAFGHASPKPTRLWSNKVGMTNHLRRGMTDNDKVRIAENKTVMSTIETDLFGNKRVTGNGVTLKHSQAYTPEFAAAVVKGWNSRWTNGDEIALEISDSSDSDYPPDGSSDEWEDADVKHIVAMMDSQ